MYYENSSTPFFNFTTTVVDNLFECTDISFFNFNVVYVMKLTQDVQ